MNTIIAIIFVLVLFILSTAGRELDTWETYFEREMEIQDSLWNVIQTYDNQFDDAFEKADKKFKSETEF